MFFLMHVLLPPLPLKATLYWILYGHIHLPILLLYFSIMKVVKTPKGKTHYYNNSKYICENMADRHISHSTVVHSLIYSKTLEINQVSKNSGMIKVDMTHPSDKPQYNYYKCSQRILDMGKIYNYLPKQVDYSEVASHAGERF